MSKGPSYYSLITAEIVFHLADDPEIRTQRLNGILADKHPEITAKLLGKAQQIVQLVFHKRMDSLPAKVLDVVILNLAPLGRMTEAEFQGTVHNPPTDKPVVAKHLSLDDPFVSL